jgi:peptide-methionine (S)-S-oxide reductase
VIRTRVGYTGGSTANPTYRNLGDHTETVQIDYDPARISYEELLEVFWESHNPRTPSFSRQYAEIIFYHDDAQKQAALQRKERAQAKQGQQMWTEIVPASTFYLAEDYHQKYQLRRVRELEAELRAIYPDPNGLTNSTAAARINGFLGGNGTLEQLQAEIDGYGLSPQAQRTLLDVMARRWGEAVYEACPLPGFE